MQELDFDSAPTTASVELLSSGTEMVVVVLALAAYLAAVGGTARLGLRMTSPRERELPRLDELSGPLRIIALLTLVSILTIEALGALDAYLMTTTVHANAAEYFASLTTVRLLGISHAHLFGYAVLYGILAMMTAFSSASPRAKSLLASALLWAGIFDVISWWGIRMLTPAFEWLTAATGATTVIASLICAVVIARDLWAGAPRLNVS